MNYPWVNKKILSWLLEGDVSIQYQVQRDLLDRERDLEKRCLHQRHGAELWSFEVLGYTVLKLGGGSILSPWCF